MNASVHKCKDITVESLGDSGLFVYQTVREKSFIKGIIFEYIGNTCTRNICLHSKMSPTSLSELHCAR